MKSSCVTPYCSNGLNSYSHKRLGPRWESNGNFLKTGITDCGWAFGGRSVVPLHSQPKKTCGRVPSFCTRRFLLAHFLLQLIIAISFFNAKQTKSALPKWGAPKSKSLMANLYPCVTGLNLYPYIRLGPRG